MVWPQPIGSGLFSWAACSEPCGTNASRRTLASAAATRGDNRWRPVQPEVTSISLAISASNAALSGMAPVYQLSASGAGRSHLARRGAVPRKDSTRSARRTTEQHGEDECASRSAKILSPWPSVVLRALRVKNLARLPQALARPIETPEPAPEPAKPAY